MAPAGSWAFRYQWEQALHHRAQIGLRAIRLAGLAAILTLLASAPSTSAAVDTPSPTAWVPNGPVNATLVDAAGRIYVGGAFDQYGPRTGYGMVVPLASSTPVAGFPEINGPVYAAVSDGAGGVFIGGAFTAVGGVARSHLAHIRADRTLDRDWDFGVPGIVRALAVSDGSLFAGGDFLLQSGNSSWSGLVKITAGGTLDTGFAANTGRPVRALATSGSALYVGGSFPDRLVKVSASSGAVDGAWAPTVGGGEVRALQVFEGGLIAGGTFSSMGGQPRNGLAEVSGSGTGSVALTWDPSPDVPAVNALALSGADLFVGGSFATMATAPHPGIAKVAAPTGAVDPVFAPDGTFVVDALAVTATELVVGGSQVGEDTTSLRRGIARVSTGKGVLNAWNPNATGSVRAIVVSGAEVFAGGEFNSAGPAVRYAGGLIRLKPDGTPDAWDINVNGTVNALALSGASLFVGGSFSRANASSRFMLAKVETGGAGTIDPTWNPGADDTVRAFALSGPDLFVGGDFLGPIGGQTRNHLAKLSTAATGAADAAWNPDIWGGVAALALSGGDLFVGGDFFQAGGQPRAGLAKVAATGTGTIDTNWDPAINGGSKLALLASGSSVFVGGNFNVLGAGANLAKLPTGGTGAPDASWKPAADKPVRALALDGDALYAGGDFTKVANQPRGGIARLSAATGLLDAGATPSVAAGGTVSALVATPNRILAGGVFTGIGALATANFALFDLSLPTVALTAPADGATYRQGQVVAAAFTCADPAGETPACTGTTAPGAAIDTGSPGKKAFTATATDPAGNVATKTVSYTVDGSAPAITITNPEQGGSYVIGTKLTVAFSCADPDGRGDVASCTGSAPNGSPLDTKVAGRRTFTVTSVDAVGNSATKAVTFTVTAASAAATRPVVSRLKIAPAAFRVKGPGAKVSYMLSAAASMTFTVTRKVGKRTKVVGSFTAKGRRGANRMTFRGKVKGKALKKGRYRLVAQAKIASGLRSKQVSVPFRVKAPR